MSQSRQVGIIVVGLGNPGYEYRGTRHNIGFSVIDELSARFKKKLQAGLGEYMLGSFHVDRKELLLVKPLMYMNNSGEAVVDVLERYPIPLENLIIVADDLALPLGKIRIRPKGSDGGHNGLYSIIYHLASSEFPRIRCGIMQPEMRPKNEMAGFVLSPFEPGEQEEVGKMVKRAADAVLEFAVSGIARTMNKFNT